ncbi:MAG: DUF2156 domain-containing protein [Clostridia bacterium]|nr:DUF2156 domain-containing protein [Clostridia bacterium]
MIDTIAAHLKYPTLADRDWVRAALMGSGRSGADFCFGCLYMWAPTYDYKIAQVDGMFVGRMGDSYTLPAGDGDPRKILDALLATSPEPLRLHAICETQKAWLEETYPGVFRFAEDRNNEDYLYRVSDLASLTGKKYHGKRNHCSYFEKNHDWVYEPMTPESALECLPFSDSWLQENADKAEEGADLERDAIERALTHFGELEFSGGILRAEGRIVAYTFGEPINDKVFDTHIEKADASVRGAYPMINREFARHTIARYEIVNREEDMGIPGLRKAKESYHPVELLKKYTALEQR